MSNKEGEKQQPPPLHASSSGSNVNFMTYQQQPLIPPHTMPSSFPQFPPFDGNYSGMSQQHMSYTNMLNSPHGLYVPALSPQQMSPNIGESGASQQNIIDVSQEVSPSKKTKKLAHKRKVPATKGASSLNSKGVSNMWWTDEHDAVLIPYLAELADTHLKVDKNFKVEAYKMAAMKLNMKFKTIYTHYHVTNRMKTWKTRFEHMKACLNISGAGWDDQNCMVTLDEETLITWAQDKTNSKLRGYINKPLPYYKQLQKIMGDDQSRGEFVMPVYDDIGFNNSIPLDDDEGSIPHESENEPQSDAHTTPVSTSRKSKHESNTKPSSYKKPRKSNDDEVLRTFVETMTESIKNQQVEVVHWTEKLAKALKTHSDSYSDDFLDKVLDHLYESEHEARRFFIKTKEAQKRFIASLAEAQGWDTSSV